MRFGPSLISRLAAAVAAICLAGLIPACDDTPEIPENLKEQAASQEPVVDLRHAADIHADRRISVPNLTFVVETDADAKSIMAVTLTSGWPDIARPQMTFTSFEHIASLESLRKSPLRFSGGGPGWLPGGNGIFSASAAYKPKSATITVVDIEEKEVRGTIEGEFYTWPLPQGIAGRPTITNMHGTFSAALSVQ